MRLSQEASTAKRNAILETGTALIRKFGPDAVGIQEIADSAGIPKGSFYNYFDSKSDFLLRALERYVQNAILWNDSVLAEAGRNKTSLLHLYQRKVAWELELLPQGISCLINFLAQISSEDQPLLRDSLAVSLHRIETGIYESLSLPEENPRAESVRNRIRILECSWRGTMLVARASGDVSYLKNFVPLYEKLILGEVQ
ncbi:TetR/AcrR family transcriptional regulator [Leptospira gomenensis]|uniref:TetR/AcrR family transcriptional regulator n=1 Tax=Leptospira gomenensis TaxID=2484974 RepID=A0A5F1Z0V2_9LEPT|nr:TetR/AcrR family transcriptional regulator [Leptospira gomenensis]TGK27570.1 TetR/AcrR family transcriptional regulator [Leptospira gomenensis]TGK38218.1 TetR/AcrR family transcriptional regulator [Leptospira gomenensis]TGK42652.1 TetR/AcrR family transcriptional regulator [Leptospira gomenensis]TGK65815.1 TetR/AcrR family transcriptional regulator [Leptospira gomenensis]